MGEKQRDPAGQKESGEQNGSIVDLLSAQQEDQRKECTEDQRIENAEPGSVLRIRHLPEALEGIHGRRIIIQPVSHRGGGFEIKEKSIGCRFARKNSGGYRQSIGGGEEGKMSQFQLSAEHAGKKHRNEKDRLELESKGESQTDHPRAGFPVESEVQPKQSERDIYAVALSPYASIDENGTTN